MSLKPVISSAISLKGSVAVVKEFFAFSVHNILYQRGIYPPESFRKTPNYGLSLMMSSDEKLVRFVDNVLNQLEGWLLNNDVQKLVLVVKGAESKETLERWVFDIECRHGSKEGMEERKGEDKTMKEITSEIQAIMRQITASATFLPILDEPCCFDLLVYADREAQVPLMTWEESDPCYIINGQRVSLRSFDTKVHKVDLAVSYKLDASAV